MKRKNRILIYRFIIILTVINVMVEAVLYARGIISSGYNATGLGIIVLIFLAMWVSISEKQNAMKFIFDV
jgi:hypothetical protein